MREECASTSKLERSRRSTNTRHPPNAEKIANRQTEHPPDRRPSLCGPTKKIGSSRITGERGADFEEEVFLVAVPVGP
ncbi:hypothetical protein, partial [Burkholderia territorii]|uniref:hypothetical protein n=1 Tax=Burkholderia territorii TaxID=1503055 RepID=UPI001E4CDBF5